ncbi:MAG: methyltransferase domain-containing protein [Patescibacteria group bacterium]|nr:methyltransferase domain-containing protein [Patescibacteria group bacterium]MDE2015391.1 methyltransferase domain-containing protein [Patescibacteria group bacterium]MDE2226994.1 methyltransferase domain-containing protein [Patescibacteria group bacterium]
MDDRKLFSGTASYYAKYRLGYPQSFFKHIIKSFNLDKTSRVLDLGTGTGQIAIAIAPYVKEVVAIDPDKEMLNEGERKAREDNIENITWIKSRAEDVSKDLGFFSLTTIGTAFHWMENQKVVDIVYDVTIKGGGIAIVSNISPLTGTESIQKDEPWVSTIWDTIREFLGERRRAGNSYYQVSGERFEDILTSSKFSRFQTWNDTYTNTRNIENIVAFLGSTSFAARRLFGNRINEFEKILTERLLEINPAGNFKEVVAVEALLAWKD